MVVEILSRAGSIITEEKSEKNRSGRTTITSVSVSDEFKDIIDKYNLSPTDVFRRGVGVTLADMGISPYNTVMNQNRLDSIRSKLELDKYEQLIKELEDLVNNLKQIIYSVNHNEKENNKEMGKTIL